MALRGRVHDGSGRAAQKMTMKSGPGQRWDSSPFGYDFYPGTLNVEVGHQQRDWLARQPGLTVASERAYYLYVPVTIRSASGAVDGHASLNRGTRSLELIAPVRLREALQVANGDQVTVSLRRAPIPKVLHQVWVGGPMPDHLARYGEQLQEMHPDWEYRLWTEAELQWLEHQDLFDDWQTNAPQNRGQWQANIARLEILYRHGGVYADCDMEPARPLDDLMGRVATGAFAVWQRNNSHPKGPLISNALCGAYRGHSTIASLLEGLRNSVRRYDGMRCTHTTGVRYWTKHITQRAKLTGHIDLFPPVTAFPYLPEHIGRIDPDAYQAPAASYLVHHWHNQRAGGHVGKYR